MSDFTERLRRVLEGDRGPLLSDEAGAHDGAAILRAAARARRVVAARTSPGDRVLLSAPRGLPWLAGFLGCVTSGRVAVPLAEGCPAPEVEALAERADARVALAHGDAARWPDGIEVTPLEADDPGGEAAETPWVDPPGHAPALFLFTSGTTGRPKAASISHDNLAAQVHTLEAAWALGARDVLLHALPLHHTHGVVVALLSVLLAGGRVRMLPRFDAEAVWEGLADATVWMGVPTMYAKLLDAERGAPDEVRARWSASARRLRLATSGSAALPASLAEAWRAIAGALPLERYGMTEIGMALGNPLAPEARRAGTVGAPLPLVEVRIVDESGADAGDGPGELWVRGPGVFAGYFGQPEATREAFAEGGWFRTGDVAVREGGSHRLLGRQSVDILKTGGEKVSALEIEEALRTLPGVGEVAVVGVPDPTWGDRVVAFVVPATGAECAPARLRAGAKERLPPFKVPKDVIVVDALPRNAMGKVQKPALVALASAGSAPRS